MEYNPAYTTTYPYGFLRLVDFSATTDSSSPVYIWGFVDNLPTQDDFHAFTVNQYAWDGKNCVTAGPHLSDPNQLHGWMNWRISHTGDLIPVTSNNSGFSSYYNGPGSFKASMYNDESIIGKTLVIYEK